MSIPRSIWRPLRLAIILALLGWLGWKAFDKTLWSAWGHFNAEWLAFALVSTLLMLAVRLAKWHLLLVKERIPRGPRESARALFGAYALASVTPGRFGDFGRFLFIGDGGRARALLFTLVDKSFDVWALLTLTFASLFLFLPLATAMVLMAGWLALIPLFSIARRRAFHLTLFSRFRLGEIWNAVQEVDARRFALLAICTYAVDMLTLFFLLRAFHNAELRVAFATYPWLVLAGSLPISFGGIGPREGVSALLLPLFSIPAPVAITVSLVFFALTGLLPAVFGAAWMAVNPPNLKRRWWISFRDLFELAGSGPTRSGRDLTST
ncbi:MAG: lysylphosphatidylglycerol synthase transmembrane domain-containing protein [Terriglobia bacterium]